MKQVIRALPQTKRETVMILTAWVYWQEIKEWLNLQMVWGLLFCAGLGIVLATLQ